MSQFHVLGIGHAIVDVLTMVEDEFIAAHGLERGAMTLVDEARAERLYEMMGQTRECSGGSAANTLAAIASLGGKAAFIGKVRDDQLGQIFAHDMRAVGVHYDTLPATEGLATARCMIFVTPDGQRTMNTFIGASAHISTADIEEALIRDAEITYAEGYLWDQPHAKEAIREALRIARSHGRKVAFTLSDTFCVERHRDEFLELTTSLDLLFANEKELLSLCETTDIEDAIARIQGACPVVALTMSEKGSRIVTAQEVIPIPPQKVSRVVDSTGAGDLYAAGFLYGMTHGWELKDCGDLASRCAAEIIQQVGARAMRPLKELVKNKAA